MGWVIGLDVHKDTIAVAALNTAGELAAESVFDNTEDGHVELHGWITANTVERALRVGAVGRGRSRRCRAVCSGRPRAWCWSRRGCRRARRPGTAAAARPTPATPSRSPGSCSASPASRRSITAVSTRTSSCSATTVTSCIPNGLGSATGSTPTWPSPTRATNAASARHSPADGPCTESMSSSPTIAVSAPTCAASGSAGLRDIDTELKDVAHPARDARRGDRHHPDQHRRDQHRHRRPTHRRDRRRPPLPDPVGVRVGNGTAPVDASSAATNDTASTAAATDASTEPSTPSPSPRPATNPEPLDYLARKRAAGKTRREALRCLKRRLSDVVYRTMIEDAARLDT